MYAHYPLDWTFVCPTEIVAFSDRVKEFEAINCNVSVWQVAAAVIVIIVLIQTPELSQILQLTRLLPCFLSGVVLPQCFANVRLLLWLVCCCRWCSAALTATSLTW